MTRYSKTMREALNEVYLRLEGMEHEEEILDEWVEIDEMKMNDPKLVRKFDKLKKGDTVKLKTSSTISKGTDFVDYVVKAKNTVNKGRVEKITLVTKGNEKAVKKFLYKRDGKVTFAIGDMGASIDDIKEKLGKDADAGDYIDDFKKSDAPQFKGKSDKKKRDMAIAAYLDAKDKKEEVELDEAKYDLYHKDFSSAMQHAYAMAKKLHGITIDPKEIDNKVATGPRKPGTGKTNTYRLKGDKGNIQIQVYNKGGPKPFELNMYKEEVELDEGKMKDLLTKGQDLETYAKKHGGIDKKDMMKVAAMLKKGDKSGALKYTKRMDTDPRDYILDLMGEENEKKPDKPDSAKAVDQARDDKKKTRIAQLQLQIAKASEMINKLNSQEKPDA